MARKRREYHLNPERMDDMSPAQRAVIGSMLSNHIRVQKVLVEKNLHRMLGTSAGPIIAVRLKMMGLSEDEMWMLLVEGLSKMKPEDFDELLVELNHYVSKGMAEKPDGATASISGDDTPAVA